MLATTDTTVATMTNVVAGAYAISAKTIIDTTAGQDQLDRDVHARRGRRDDGHAEFEFEVEPDYVDLDVRPPATLSLEITRVFAATGRSCSAVRAPTRPTR